MSYIEIIGIIATILLVMSMAYNSKNRKTILVMRSLNAISSLLFIIYSIVLFAYSTILSNLIILLIDIYYILKTYKNKD